MFGRTILMILLVAICGCSRGPSRLAPPDIDAESAAQAALSAYDKNSDAKLDDAELKSCPAMFSAKAKYDSNGDNSVSAEEIAERIRSWSSQRMAVTSYFCRVYFKGRPLAGANVEFIPEPFLGDAVKPASGRTKNTGYANLAIAPADLPPDLPLSGVHLGLYKVKITHPQMSIPKHYNEQTTLGHEVTLSRDSAGPAEFNLTSG